MDNFNENSVYIYMHELHFYEQLLIKTVVEIFNVWIKFCCLFNFIEDKYVYCSLNNN